MVHYTGLALKGGLPSIGHYSAPAWNQLTLPLQTSLRIFPRGANLPYDRRLELEEYHTITLVMYCRKGHWCTRISSGRRANVRPSRKVSSWPGSCAANVPIYGESILRYGKDLRASRPTAVAQTLTGDGHFPRSTYFAFIVCSI
jgi:hypothetical protein